MVRSMLMLVVASVVVAAGEAQAQLFAPVFQPVIIVQEEWRPVKFGGTVSYILDGHYHFVTDGVHWQTGEDASARCAHTFVEPFDCWGNRIPKAVSGFHGAEWSFQFGPKTYNVRNGETYFGTWVSRGGEIKFVWCKIENPVPISNEVSPTPIEVPYDSPEVEPAPMSEEELVIPVPQRKDFPAPPVLVPPAPNLK